MPSILFPDDGPFGPFTTALAALEGYRVELSYNVEAMRNGAPARETVCVGRIDHDGQLHVHPVKDGWTYGNHEETPVDIGSIHRVKVL